MNTEQITKMEALPAPIADALYRAAIIAGEYDSHARVDWRTIGDKHYIVGVSRYYIYLAIVKGKLWPKHETLSIPAAAAKYANPQYGIFGARFPGCMTWLTDAVNEVVGFKNGRYYYGRDIPQMLKSATHILGADERGPIQLYPFDTTTAMSENGILGIKNTAEEVIADPIWKGSTCVTVEPFTKIEKVARHYGLPNLTIEASDKYWVVTSVGERASVNVKFQFDEGNGTHTFAVNPYNMGMAAEMTFRYIEPVIVYVPPTSKLPIVLYHRTGVYEQYNLVFRT